MINLQDMKKFILSIIALALSMMSAYAQTVSVNDVTIKAGETKVVGINLNNTQTNIVSFQMDLTLPDGITINKAGCALGSRIADTDQELTIGRQPDGSIRLTSTSFALSPITGTSGEIVKLSLTAAKDAKGGVVSTASVLATSNSEKLKPANASFKVKVSYILTYKVDGNVYKTVPVEYGAAITSEAAPTKEGHTFSGWSNLPATMPNHNVEVTGTFSINSYTLTYKVDGNVYKTSTVPYGSSITPEAAPTKEGYTFSGWSEIPKTMPAKDVVVTGSFTINKYKLTYMVDGEVYKTFTLAYGTAITPEASPTKEGYTFSGWSEVPKTMPAHDVVVTGSFSKGQYVLTYIVDGQTYKSIRMDYGNTIVPETAPTKEGYTFSGWSEIPKTMPAHDVTVTGSFTINKYKLTYMVDGVVYKTYEINYGTAITPEAVPTKEGYTFSGWSEIPKTMPAHDVTVTGSFSINPHIPDSKPYAVLSENNTVLTFYYDDQMESRGGMDVYKIQWNRYSGYITTVVFDESFASYTTLTSTASWFKDCSKLTNIVDFGNLRTDNVTDMWNMFYGCSSLTTLDLSGFNTENVKSMGGMFVFCENLKTIYVREGWNTDNVEESNSMFSSCLKLVGGSGTTYNKNHTTVEYAHIDGGVSNPGYLTYKDYYYTLIYMVDGEEYKSYRLEIGEEITPEPKPTKDGYVFLGWDNIPATMPDYDVVVTGAFYPYGDVNKDKEVNVVDVVDIARFVVGTPSDSFVKVLADLNNDGSVNLSDAVVLINDIAGDQNFVKALVTPEITSNDMLKLKYNNGNFSLCLNNEHQYTAFQLDLYIPENESVSKMILNAQRTQKHQLLYNKVEEGHYRVAALSTSNNKFNDNEGELLNIVMNGVSYDEVSVRDIHFFDVKGIDYQFDDIYGSTVTSVRQIDNGKLIMENSIYDLQGRKRSTLQRGVNIVGGNKVIVK